MNEYDINGNGKIDPDEREIMLEDRRRNMEDMDKKREEAFISTIKKQGRELLILRLMRCLLRLLKKKELKEEK